MNIEARKISVAKEVLNIDNENTIRAIEELLHKKQTDLYEDSLRPMTMEEYRSEINKSIDDEKKERLIEAVDLKKQIEL